MAKDKVVLITGGFGGIGKALALKFGEAGAKVILWDMFIDEEFESRLEKLGIPFLAQKVDITDKVNVSLNAKEAFKKWNRIDVLINNAGITKDKLVLRMEEDDWNAVLDVNLKGTFLCSKIIGRFMFMQKSGKIINLASIIGQIGNLGQANYSASKGGVIALTKSLAKEFARAGVNVNAIAPGYIMTKMTENLPEKSKKEMLNRIPMGRLGKPDEVADIALFLASDGAAYITGQVIRVDGGMVM
jgi:3-oxoacyl-[acyl-carrier protein] reductase